VFVDCGQRLGEVRRVDLGEEAEPAEVHSEHRHLGVADQSHGPQRGAVAAQADDQVGAGRRADRRQRARWCSGAGSRWIAIATARATLSAKEERQHVVRSRSAGCNRM
jgi:hypothetical protein